MNGAKEVELMAKLGEGAYGSVYKGRMTNTDQIVAVKVIRINAEDEGISSTTLR
jgi:serine/threonine protein kinase